MPLPKSPGAIGRGSVEEQMRLKAYIRNHYSDILGDDIRLLDLPNGLELAECKIKEHLARYGIILNRITRAA